MTARRSSGTAGEEAAAYWFARHGWRMWKVPPDIRVCGQTGRPGVFLAAFKPGGMPDFLGCNRYGDFMAVEVKECRQNSMPASRLSQKQRAFLSSLREGQAHVGVLWRDGKFEVFQFVNQGSYKKSYCPVAE